MTSFPMTPLVGATVSLAVTAASGRVALGGTSAAVSQGVKQTRQYVVESLATSAAEAFIRFGDVTATAVAATDYPILPGSVQTFSSADDYIAAICAVDTATIRISAVNGDGPSLAASSGTSSGSAPLSPVSTASITSVNSAAVTGQLLAANASRKGLILVNTDANALYLKYGTTATTAGGGYTALIPSGAYWEMPLPVYTGRIDGIWAADGAGLVELTEL